MVAECDRVHALAQQGLGDGAGDARARRGVFRIGDHKIQAVLLTQSTQPGRDLVPARTAHDVANKKNPYHRGTLHLGRTQYQLQNPTPWRPTHRDRFTSGNRRV